MNLILKEPDAQLHILVLGVGGKGGSELDTGQLLF